MKANRAELSVARYMEIRDLQKRFEKVEALLRAKPWFSKDKWVVSQHPFPSVKPDGVTLHVYKRHWFNDEGLGIHFESYLDLNPKKLKKTYLTLHALHYDEIPGKSIDRKKFAKPLVDSIHDEVAAWDGYSFRAGKYGLQPFARFFDASSEQFEMALVKEIERLCKHVGPQIDTVLSSLIS